MSNHSHGLTVMSNLFQSCDDRTYQKNCLAILYSVSRSKPHSTRNSSPCCVFSGLLSGVFGTPTGFEWTAGAAPVSNGAFAIRTRYFPDLLYAQNTLSNRSLPLSNSDLTSELLYLKSQLTFAVTRMITGRLAGSLDGGRHSLQSETRLAMVRE